MVNQNLNLVYSIILQPIRREVVMGFIPGKKITISTDFTVDQVIEQLHKITEPNRGLSVFRQRSPNIIFRGDLSGNSFKLQALPQIAMVNSFTPVVIGKIDQGKIDITMRFNMTVLIFWILWMTIASVFCFIITAVIFINKRFGGEYLIPYFLWLFGFFFCRTSFNSESRRVEAALRKILS